MPLSREVVQVEPQDDLTIVNLHRASADSPAPFHRMFRVHQVLPFLTTNSFRGRCGRTDRRLFCTRFGFLPLA